MFRNVFVFMFGFLTSALYSAGAPVYIVGQQINQTPDATLWITDTSGKSPKTVVLGNQIEESYAISLTAINNKLFCLGNQKDETGENATLWITDTKGSSVSAVTLENFAVFDAANGQEMTSVNTKIFCVGAYGTNATLLCFDTINQTQETFTLNTENTSLAIGVTSANNKIYCFGEELESNLKKVKLWITDTSGTILNTIVLAEASSASASDITATNNKIYCVGLIDNEPKLWITDTDGTILSTIDLNSELSSPASITVKGDRLYILSNKIQPNEPITLCILDSSGNFIKNVDLGLGQGYSVASLGQQIFAVGSVGSLQNPSASLWVTDTLSSSVFRYTIAPSISSAEAIYIYPQTFYQALQKFSPVHFQKGI